MTTEEIEEESAGDEELEYVRQSIETGNWENSNCANQSETSCVFSERLSVEGLEWLCQVSYEQE